MEHKLLQRYDQIEHGSNFIILHDTSTRSMERHQKSRTTTILQTTDIGWNQVLMGRLSKTWVDIQNMYAPNSVLNGISIITTATTKIYRIVTAIWKARCDTKYRKIDQPTYRSRILEPRVDNLYQARTQVNTTDQTYFEVPIETIEKFNTLRLQQWMLEYKYKKRVTMLLPISK